MEYVYTKAAPPRNGQIHRIATTTSVQRIALPATITGIGRVRMRAVGAGADAQFYFAPADTGQVIVIDSVTALQMGWSLPVDEQFEDYDFTGAEVILVVIARAAGFLEMYRSGKERTDQR